MASKGHRREQMLRPLKEIGQGREGARADQFKAAGQRLHPAVRAPQVRQAEFSRHLLDESRLLGDRVQACDCDVAAHDRDHHPRQTGTRPHIEQRRPPRPLTSQGPDDGQAVEQVMGQDARGVAQRSQVVNLVPFQNQRGVGQKLFALAVIQAQPERRRALAQLPIGTHSPTCCDSAAAFCAKARCPPLRKWIISSEIAAGVTPEMREASPSVSGRCLASFCRTSKLSALTCP